MSAKVWVSSLFNNYQIGDKQGLRVKYVDENFESATFKLGVPSKKVQFSMRRYQKGYPLSPDELPEKVSVWNWKAFSKVRSIFMAGPFYVVKGDVYEIIRRYDLGQGALVPTEIYIEESKSHLNEETYFWIFGNRKDSLSFDGSKNFQPFVIDEASGLQVWDTLLRPKPGDIALQQTALDGPDVWFEERLHNKLFLSDALGTALLDSSVGKHMYLTTCRVEE